MDTHDDDAAERAEVERLCSEYLPYSAKLARKWGRDWGWLSDDFESEAAMALWRAAEVRGNYKIPFKLLVRLFVTRRCLNLLRKESARPDSPFNAVRAAPGGPPVVQGVTDDATDGCELVDLYDLLDQLPSAQRWRIERRYLDAETLQAIGEAVGVSKPAALQAVRKAVRTLRELALAKDERE